MPIKIPCNLPAHQILTNENIFVMDEHRACTQDIRPLKLLIVNLMPTKIDTETQLIRLLSNTPLQEEVELLHTKTHQSKNTSQDHLKAFYKTFEDVKDFNFDGMIITGAPVEKLDFEQVEYWNELCSIMEWSKTHVHSTIHICWAAQAALYYHYGIKKKLLPKKISGIFAHHVDYRQSILFRGFDDTFMVPQSRHTAIDEEAVKNCQDLKILASSDESGLYALSTENGKQIFITGHSEYDALTLDNEYKRDLKAGLNPDIPKNYYPDNDPSKAPIVSWRSCASLLYSNWLNYFVYQTTPYNLDDIPSNKIQEKQQ